MWKLFERNSARSRKLSLVFISLLVLASTIGVYQFTSIQGLHDVFGVCGGYSSKLLDEIPTDVVIATDAYFKDVQPVSFLGSISAVDPVRESMVPHRCIGVPEDPTISKQEEEILVTEQKRYSGVIPPGATKAVMVAVNHAPKFSTYKGKDPVLARLAKNGAYTTSSLIVAYYPNRGWIGVFDDPEIHGGLHR